MHPVPGLPQSAHQAIRQEQFAHAHCVQPDPAPRGKARRLSLQPQAPALRQAPGAGPGPGASQGNRQSVAEIEGIHATTLS